MALDDRHEAEGRVFKIVGTRPLRPDEVLSYFRALAQASPRARLMEYSRSHEGRPLVILAISDEATVLDLLRFCGGDGFHERLEEHRSRVQAKKRAEIDTRIE